MPTYSGYLLDFSGVIHLYFAVVATGTIGIYFQAYVNNIWTLWYKSDGTVAQT